jgi:predicted component of type VI protein secretion system
MYSVELGKFEERTVPKLEPESYNLFKACLGDYAILGSRVIRLERRAILIITKCGYSTWYYFTLLDLSCSSCRIRGIDNKVHHI